VATSRIAESVGRVLGDRYRLTRPLGVGASAHVYVAEDVTLKRRVAIKVLHPALAADEAFLRRFRAEAQVVAGLRHPNILTVYDWGEDGGSPYLVMELLEGGSLRSMLDRGLLLSPAQAAQVGADAARALDYAHRRGLVHRDIKPANLIFDDEGRVTVADFGLARALAEATWTEPAGAVVGTARYAAPEQVRGEKLDSRADVYSLALVLVEAITGTVPFASDTTLGTLMARVGRAPTVPDEAGPLKPVLEAAGAPDAADRLDASSLANALDRAGSKLPRPAPLQLGSPLSTDTVDSDPHPTEYPGRPKLFDAAAFDTDRGEPLVSDRRRFDEYAPEGGFAAVSGAQVRGAPDSADGDAPRQARSGRRARRLVAAAVVLVLLGAGAAGAVFASRALTPSHPVPGLVGDTAAKAESLLRPLHFHLSVSSRVYSKLPVGEVVAQNPRGGRLKEGQTISVELSRGPQPVPVPTNLTGVPLSAAKSVLQTLGLSVGAVRYASSMTVPPGDVIGSSPASGTLLPGQPVSLVVSNGKPKVTIPALTTASSASFDAAKAALAQSGLVAVDVPAYSDTVPVGHVITTQPGPGTMATVGDRVSVLVSKGPQLIDVPDVRGDTVDQANARLTADGFTVSGVNGSPSARVTGTNPAQGTPLRKGSPVQINTT
jgi:eukaryotic-like serine/threonine-protein kinase